MSARNGVSGDVLAATHGLPARQGTSPNGVVPAWTAGGSIRPAHSCLQAGFLSDLRRAASSPCRPFSHTLEAACCRQNSAVQRIFYGQSGRASERGTGLGRGGGRLPATGRYGRLQLARRCAASSSVSHALDALPAQPATEQIEELVRTLRIDELTVDEIRNAVDFARMRGWESSGERAGR